MGPRGALRDAVTVALLVTSVASCSTTPPHTDPAPVSPTDAVSLPADTAGPSACPTASAAHVAAYSAAGGFCFVHPASHVALHPPGEAATLTLSPAPSVAGGSSIEAPGPYLAIEPLGEAGGRSPDEIARSVLRSALENPGLRLQPRAATIAGRPAVVYDGVPGTWSTRQGFVVADGRSFVVSAMPWNDPALASLQEQSAALWDEVTGTLVFVPPGAAAASPTAGPGGATATR